MVDVVDVFVADISDVVDVIVVDMVDVADVVVIVVNGDSSCVRGEVLV